VGVTAAIGTALASNVSNELLKKLIDVSGTAKADRPTKVAPEFTGKNMSRLLNKYEYYSDLHHWNSWAR
jgi:hypothetical protein